MAAAAISRAERLWSAQQNRSRSPRGGQQSSDCIVECPFSFRLEEVDPMLFIERHNRLLPAFGLSLLETVLPRLASAILRANFIDLDVEQLLDRTPHIVLRRLKMHLER